MDLSCGKKTLFKNHRDIQRRKTKKQMEGVRDNIASVYIKKINKKIKIKTNS